MFSLEGKVAVVTGGASGIGLATARRFAKAGAKVIVADMNDDDGIAEEAGVETPGQIAAFGGREFMA